MKRIVNVFCILMLLLMILYEGCISNGFDGFVVLLGLYMVLLNPVYNLFRVKKKIINNLFYYLLVLGLSIYNIYVYGYSLYLFFKFGHNESILYISTVIIPSIIALLTIFVYSCFLKKERKKDLKDNSPLIYLLLSIICFIPTLTDPHLDFPLIVNYIIGAYLIVLALRSSSVMKRAELQKNYAVIIIASLLVFNIVPVVVLFQLYLDLDQRQLY